MMSVDRDVMKMAYCHEKRRARSKHTKQTKTILRYWIVPASITINICYQGKQFWCVVHYLLPEK